MSESSARKLVTHVVCGSCMMLTALSLGGSTLAVLAECCHQALDASHFTGALSHPLTLLFHRSTQPEQFAFGAARLPALIAMGVQVCAGGGALIVGLEALQAIIIAEDAVGESLRTLAAAAVASALASAAAPVRDNAQRGGEERQGKAQTPSTAGLGGWPICRAATLALLAAHRVAVGASMPADGSDAAAAAFPASWRQDAPPLIAGLLSLLLRQPDAMAAALLCTLASTRVARSLSRSSHVFLQGLAPNALPALNQRLKKARQLPGVLGITDERFWALDESSTVGSLHVIIRGDVDAQRVSANVHRTFAGLLTHLTVQVERDEA
jgi:Co/Zn/Cd efflux system component